MSATHVIEGTSSDINTYSIYNLHAHRFIELAKINIDVFIFQDHLAHSTISLIPSNISNISTHSM